MILLTHVVCWVIKPLDIQVLECIEIMFKDQFEVVNQDPEKYIKRSHLSLLKKIKIFMKIFPFLDSAGLNFIVFFDTGWHYHNSGPEKLLILSQIPANHL